VVSQKISFVTHIERESRAPNHSVSESQLAARVIDVDHRKPVQEKPSHKRNVAKEKLAFSC